jgi:hypothetical protein
MWCVVLGVLFFVIGAHVSANSTSWEEVDAKVRIGKKRDRLLDLQHRHDKDFFEVEAVLECNGFDEERRLDALIKNFHGYDAPKMSDQPEWKARQWVLQSR